MFVNNVLVNLRHRRDPKKNKGQKYWNEKGGKASIFNSVALENNHSYIVICEGEFDAIIATQNGFPSVSSTAGASTFKKEWVKEFESVKQIYICFDTDEAGVSGAKKVASFIGDRARIVKLPKNGEEKVDLTDFFVKQGHSADDFQKLLDEAKSHKPKVKLLNEESDSKIHPAVDYKDSKLFYTFELPVQVDDEKSKAVVVITSNKQVGIDKNRHGYIDFENKTYSLRDVSLVPNNIQRWKVEDINKFLVNKDKVSPSLAFIEIKEVLKKFVDFRDENDADIIALWLMGTYCFPVFDAYPYLYLVGVKRSGKTKTLLIIEKLAFNAIISSNISPAVLFRLVEAKRPTLALDEGEQLSDKTRKQELRELLNSGYKRGAPAYRTTKNKKGNFDIEAFEIYSPKAIANISGLDDVLEDRSITLTMVRTNNPDKGNTAVTEGSEDWSYLRNLLYSFSLDYSEKIAKIYSSDSKVNALLNRQNELWKPLLSIAKIIDTELPGTFENIRDEAIRRAEETSSVDLDDFDSAVLIALRELVGQQETVELENKEIKDKASEYLEIDQRQYFTSRGVGAALKRFGIRGRKVRGYCRYKVKVSIVKDLLRRYGIPNLEMFG